MNPSLISRYLNFNKFPFPIIDKVIAAFDKVLNFLG